MNIIFSLFILQSTFRDWFLFIWLFSLKFIQVLFRMHIAKSSAFLIIRLTCIISHKLSGWTLHLFTLSVKFNKKKFNLLKCYFPLGWFRIVIWFVWSFFTVSRFLFWAIILSFLQLDFIQVKVTVGSWYWLQCSV